MWKYIKILSGMGPRRLEKDNKKTCLNYCVHFGYLFSLSVNTSVKMGLILYTSTEAQTHLQNSCNVYAGSGYKEDRVQSNKVKKELNLTKTMKSMDRYEAECVAN